MSTFSIRHRFFGSKQAINIISNGIDNFSRLAMVDQGLAMDRGITINGLVQMRGYVEDTIKDFFRKQVVDGPSSFVQVANGTDGFAQAMLRKMILELALLNGLSWADGT